MPTVTINTTETTFVSSAQPNNNFSFFPLLYTGTDPAYQYCISYIKFMLPPLSRVDSAILKLSVIVKTGVTPSPVVVNRVTSPLNTATVTYNTQPTFTPTSTELNITTADLYKAVEFDVTATVNQWLSGAAPNDGFALTNSDGTTLVEFATNNIVYPPYFPVLILTYSTTPPPTTPTIISGVGAPTCSLGNNGDLYVETSTGQLFFKQTLPTAPLVREIPIPSGNTLHVGPTRAYTTIQSALDAAVNGDLLLLDPVVFTITSPIIVNKSVTIAGHGIGMTEVITTTPSVVNMFEISVSDVVIKDMKIVQNFPSALSVETVIAITNLSATGIYINSCEISACELGITTKAMEFQITNCNFTYAPLAALGNNYYYIFITSTNGTSIIDHNTFAAESGNSRCRFIIITNVAVSSGTLQGKLLISNNSQVSSSYTLRHLLVIEDFVGSGFELFINNNTTISEGNAPVLFFNAKNDIFRFVEVVGNNIQNTAGKGLIGIDGSSTGTTDIFSSGNVIANPFFTTGWASGNSACKLHCGI